MFFFEKETSVMKQREGSGLCWMEFLKPERLVSRVGNCVSPVLQVLESNQVKLFWLDHSLSL